MELEKLTVNEGTEELSTFTHGMLFSLHVLGIFYNVRRKKPFQALFHGAVAAYDLYCSVKHNQGRNNLSENDKEYMDRIRTSGL